jgi:hypothetical protein
MAAKGECNECFIMIARNLTEKFVLIQMTETKVLICDSAIILG